MNLEMEIRSFFVVVEALLIGLGSVEGLERRGAHHTESQILL